MDGIRQMQQHIQQSHQDINTITQMASQLVRSEQQNQNQLQQITQSESRSVQQLQQIERICQSVSQQLQSLSNIARQVSQTMPMQQFSQYDPAQYYGTTYTGQGMSQQGLTTPKPTYPMYSRPDQYSSQYQYTKSQYGEGPQFSTAQQSSPQVSQQFENPWYQGYSS